MNQEGRAEAGREVIAKGSLGVVAKLRKMEWHPGSEQ